MAAKMGIDFTYKGQEFIVNVFDYNDGTCEAEFYAGAGDYVFTIGCRSTHWATDCMDTLDGIESDHVTFIGGTEYVNENGAWETTLTEYALTEKMA
jgi:hypothetical protein